MATTQEAALYRAIGPLPLGNVYALADYIEDRVAAGGGGLTPIPSLNLLANPTGGSAAPTAVSIDSTLSFASSVLKVATGTSGAAIPLLSTGNTWGGVQTFGANVTGSTAAVWRTITGNSTSLGCLASAAADHIRWGGSTNQIFLMQPTSLSPNLSAFTGQTWGGSGMAGIIGANTWTGTVVGGVTGFFPTMFLNQTYNLAVGGGGAGPIKVIIQNGANFDGSLYAMDVQVSAVVNQSHAIGGNEFHGSRWTTQASANLGGTVSGSGLGILIGAKFGTVASAAATFLSIHNPVEVVTSNAGTADYSYGVLARDTSTGTSFIDNAGLATCSDSSFAGSGYDVGLLFGSTFYGAPVHSGGSLIATTNSTGGGAFTCLNGIDFSKMTFTGFAMKIGAMTVIDATNNITGASFAVGTSGPTITAGSGVPAATVPKGSIYLRTGGTVGSTIYVSQGGGTWNPVAAV